MPFLNDLELKPDNGDLWILTDSFRYRTEAGEPILVPRGFVNDLATIPRMLRLFVDVNGPHRKAAVIHDWLYYKHGHTMGQQFTRLRCDEIFLEAMKASGVGYLTRMAMYYAVRVGGWYPWYSTLIEK